MSWKDDIVHEICYRYCGPKANELGDPAKVRLILDQWAPLSVDEAESDEFYNDPNDEGYGDEG